MPCVRRFVPYFLIAFLALCIIAYGAKGKLPAPDVHRAPYHHH
jgi:hypothetical protein